MSEEPDTRLHLLDSALRVIARDGLHGMTMRAVASEADCALGLLNYHFDDKDALVVEAYQRIADRLIAASAEATDATDTDDERVGRYLEVVFRSEFLNTDYLALRLSLWAAVASDPKIAALNERLDLDYWGRLSELIRTARPDLTTQQAEDRATDVVITQNGIWLTWVVRRDEAALERAIAHCIDVALAPA